MNGSAKMSCAAMRSINYEVNTLSRLIHLFYVMFSVSRRIQMGVESHACPLDRFAYLSIVTSL